LGVQEEAKRLAVDVRERDGGDLQLRVGLNSGQVIAGEIGSGALGYTTVGEQVGLAQRMESVASPGEVMLSASTARLVEAAAVLGGPEMVRIKGADEPVCARRLLGVSDRHRAVVPIHRPLPCSSTDCRGGGDHATMNAQTWGCWPPLPVTCSGCGGGH
jgi:class 3 adenylate cyclase